MAERKTFLLRMDPALWGELEAWAADELRSVNGQIEYVLKQAVARRKGAPVLPAASGDPPPSPPSPSGSRPGGDPAPPAVEP